MEEGETDLNEYVDNLTAEYQSAQNRNLQLSGALATSGMFNRDNENLIVWQVNTDDLLERIEHYLRGDVPTKDEEGNIEFKKQKNKELILLNDFGVSSMMEILSRYVTKDLILSYFTEESRFMEIIADLGDELNDYLLCNYDKMGMDDIYKRSKRNILVLSTLHLIEFTARRAFRGKQMEEINTGRIITQSEGLGNRQFQQMPGQMKQKRGILGSLKWW